MKCTHERLNRTINDEQIVCSDCGTIIDLSSGELKEKINQLTIKNRELSEWIRNIEKRNDDLIKENDALKVCLKMIL